MFQSPQQRLAAMAAAQAASKQEHPLEDKLITVIEATRSGRMQAEELRHRLEAEMEIVQVMQLRVPRRDMWNRWATVLELYLGAVEQLLALVADGQLDDSEAVKSALSKAYDADSVLHDMQQNTEVEVVND